MLLLYIMVRQPLPKPDRLDLLADESVRCLEEYYSLYRTIDIGY